MRNNPTRWLRRIIPAAMCMVVGHALLVAAAPPAAANDVLQALRTASVAPVAVSYSAATGAADFVSGEVPVSGDNPGLRARDFMTYYGRLFGVRDVDAELRVLRETSDAGGMSHIAYEQTYDGVPVFGARLVVHMDDAGRVVAANGQFQPGIALSSVAPAIDADAARAVALADLGGPLAWQGKPRLVIWTHDRGGADARLAWELRGLAADPPARWHYFVDAQSGVIAYRLDELTAAKDRRVYTTFNGSALPGAVLRCTELAPICTGGDTAAQHAFDFSGTIYDYYNNNFGRDSYDGNGAPLTSTVHYGVNVPLAFWNGNEVVFGDGGGSNMTSTVTANDLDLAAHEWAHAVTEYTSNLFYEGESGALNESYSDVFAVFITPTNWLIGDVSYIADPIYGLRSLADPTKGGQWNPDMPATSAGQPDRMAVIGVMPDQLDNGGVHINSGIPNKAAYLLTNGGTFQGIPVNGIGFGKAQQIYYRAQTLYNTPFTDFANAARNTYQACRDLVGQFGVADGDCDSVFNAWAAVGVLPPHRLYLPLVASAGGVPQPPATGIYGRVTEGGTAAASMPVRLAQCPALGDSSSCTFVTSTTTAIDGSYRFTPASLPAGQQYVVQYRQSATCARLGEWNGNWVIPFSISDNRSGGDFDINATVPITPQGLVGGVAQVFQWTGRTLPPNMTADLPEFQLYDSSGTGLLYSQVLARGSTSIMPPAGLVEAFHAYQWTVAVLGPQGRGEPVSTCKAKFGSSSLQPSTGDSRFMPELFDRR